VWVEGLFDAPAPIADGGFVDWGARLLTHRREQVLTIGTELLGRALV
jgi:hypothetical protein